MSKLLCLVLKPLNFVGKNKTSFYQHPSFLISFDLPHFGFYKNLRNFVLIFFISCLLLFLYEFPIEQNVCM